METYWGKVGLKVPSLAWQEVANIGEYWSLLGGELWGEARGWEENLSLQIGMLCIEVLY